MALYKYVGVWRDFYSLRITSFINMWVCGEIFIA